MMGGGAFIWLKAGSQVQESAKQAEIRLAGLLKILHIARSATKNALAEGARHMQWLCRGGFLPDMANWPGDVPFVIQITVLAEKMAQYSATQCRG
jgi:hypothetical protein